MKKVVILQEYVPQYRVPLFELLKRKLLESGIDLVVAAGEPSSSQSQRHDKGRLDWATPVRQVELRVLGRRVVFRQTRKVLAGADLVIVEQARRNLDVYLLMARRHRPVVALWGHGVDRTRPVTRVERWLSTALLRNCDWFFAYTEGTRRLVEDLDVDPAKITVVQNAIDTSSLREAINALDGGAIQDFERQLDLRGKTALYIGALDTYKRVSMLIETADAAHSMEPNFRLVVAGDGADRHIVEAASRSRSYIVYLGQRFGHDKAKALAAADLLVSAGSVGLGVLDSFAAQVPMVITDWPYHGPEVEYLQDKRNAVVTPDSAVDLATGLVSTLSDTEAMGRLRTHCGLDAQLFTVEEMANRFVDGVLKALGAGQA